MKETELGKINTGYSHPTEIRSSESITSFNVTTTSTTNKKKPAPQQDHMTLRDAHLEESITITENSTVVEVARLLRDRKKRHAYVLDEKEFPVGIVSTTDINARVVAEGKSPEGLTVKDIMTRPIHMVEIDDDVTKAYFEMIAHETGAVPVIDNGVIQGVLSMSEVIRLLAHRKKDLAPGKHQ